MTTPAEIAAGKDVQGFNCNVDLVGQYQGEGASWQLTAWKNCAYFDQRMQGTAPQLLTHPGSVVVDVTDPTHPTPTAWLASNPMLDPWESIKVNSARQLLGAGWKFTNNVTAGNEVSIYDISADCKQPVLKKSLVISGMLGHTGQFAPDGNTYYVTPLQNTQTIIAVDTKDPANPAVIPCANGTYGCPAAGAGQTTPVVYNGFFTAPATSSALGPGFGTARWHDLEFSKDGNTAYVSMLASGATASANGLVIVDVSDFQSRKKDAQGNSAAAYRIIGSLTWDDGSVGAQNALPVTIAGKPYILFTDESGGPVTGCSSGKSAAGFPRLIDISDPSKPTTAAKLILDIHDPANCQVSATTPVTSSAVTNTGFTSSGPFGFSCHYCNVDDADNAKIAACSCFAAGWRFFDISNVNYVREIAYYKPPAQGTKALPGSQYANSTVPGFVRHFDWATSKPSFPKDRAMTSGDVWITSQDNGFMVVRLDPNATASISGSSGCASADVSVAALLVFGIAELVRRRRARKV